MARILLYYPSNKRSVALETLVTSLRRRGQDVELLTTCERGELHERLAAGDVRVHAHPVRTRPRVLYYARQILHLARFCRAREVTVVFSHLQHANIIAICSQYLFRAPVIVFRHHFYFSDSDDRAAAAPNPAEARFDRIINRLARTIVVPSTGVAEGMAASERVEMERVRVIRYVYDFSRYPSPSARGVDAVRARYPARLRLLISARLIPEKRHVTAFRVVRGLVDEGLDLQLLVLDDGPERRALAEFIRAHRLEDRIHMLGYRRDFVDFMGACDLLVHPSLTEASSNVVKEMALLGKPAIVCAGVGDFDEYVEHRWNGYRVSRGEVEAESAIAAIIREACKRPENLELLGRRLRQSVLARFSVTPERVDRYIALAERGDDRR